MENLMICGSESIVAKEFIKKYRNKYKKIVYVDISYESNNLTGQDFYLKADLTQKQDLENIKKILHEYNFVIDQLLFTVGINNMQDIFSNSIESWKNTFETNVTSFYNCIKFFYTFFSSESSVLTLSSQNGVSANYNRIDYGPSKAALIHLVKNLTLDFSKYKKIDLKINSLSPGVIINQKNQDFLTSSSGQKYRKENPYSDFVQIEEVISTIYFLLDNSIRSFRGSNIVLDNGFSL